MQGIPRSDTATRADKGPFLLTGYRSAEAWTLQWECKRIPMTRRDTTKQHSGNFVVQNNIQITVISSHIKIKRLYTSWQTNVKYTIHNWADNWLSPVFGVQHCKFGQINSTQLYSQQNWPHVLCGRILFSGIFNTCGGFKTINRRRERISGIELVYPRASVGAFSSWCMFTLVFIVRSFRRS